MDEAEVCQAMVYQFQAKRRNATEINSMVGFVRKSLRYDPMQCDLARSGNVWKGF